MRHHAAHRVFTHADVNDVWIALGNSNRADRPSLKVTVGDVSPTDSHVFCFPETAASRSHVIGFGIANDARAGVRASTTKRSDRPPLERFENSVVIVGRRRGLC